MTTFSNGTEVYFDDPAARSPRSSRQSQLHRQASKPFDSYGNMPNAFGAEGMMPPSRFDNGRDTFNSGFPTNTMNTAHFPYDVGAAQTWNASTGPSHPLGGGLGGPMQPIGSSFGAGRLKPSRGRVGLPGPWTYEPMPPMPPQYANYDNNRMPSQSRQNHLGDADDELIPTAIVIKNIPFAVKKEQLVQLMTEMHLPLPYAFNYHFDNGVFRGLAFANFTSADETAAVIQRLNHLELSGRKLRVEYKKMLPVEERERIEREKRERRGQLEEQHRPIPQSQLHTQISMSSLPRTSPSPLSQRNAKPDVDMNDPKILELFSEIIRFQSDPNREVLIFPPTLEPTYRRVVHTLAHQQGLMHVSRGSGEQRQVHVYRIAPTNVSPPNSSISGAFQGSDGYRRGLSRAATTDFSEARQPEPSFFGQLRGQSSVGLLGVNDTNNFGSTANLRPAKSVADLRAYTPSPAHSNASFPSNLQANGLRLQQLDGPPDAHTPTLTPTTSNSGHGLSRDENFLIGGMNGLSVGNGFGSQHSPRRQRSMFTSQWEEPQVFTAPAPIGSNRTVTAGQENGTQDRSTIRNARGTSANERGPNYRRQNGRGSDESRGNPDIIVE